ncbi:Nucleotide-binding universal stress protein, UspA family [Vreelandella subterranea]|uniref:Nucleotide-binding universal stress protein, UspA family n=1 Tax=Vreelandella subterranea TaxID=416874 RepID=A0A1H9S6U4_9GAMM|nr:universal stress protein [Halomonas subterranea]SER80700.1 Nucleotide-binding universal stress protein, UspA family [Halomonas subterranea]
MSDRVLAAIDSSQFSEGVCDYAAWAAKALDAPLAFIHVLDNRPQVSEPDLTGNLGLGTREHLLEKLSDVEEQHAKLARERGRLVLDDAKQRALKAGVEAPDTLQRNGTLVETLVEQEKSVRLLVVGKRGETAHQASGHIGSNLERVVREVHRPILMVPRTFTHPENVMMAFDGSKTARKGVEMLAKSPLFNGTTCHIVIVGAETAEHRSQLDWALSTLTSAGHTAEGAIRAGDVEETLRAYKEEHGIDMLVMGAYGHSRIRHLLVGSTTTAMLRKAQLPVLILR